jgi:hypothetical protein
MAAVLFVTHNLFQGSNITYKTAADDASRGMFQTKGVLDDQGDTNLRAISDDSPVFAISKDFGTIQATQLPFVWAIGFTTEPAINYTSICSTMQSYYKSQYSDNENLVSTGLFWGEHVSDIHVQIIDFLNNFSNASLSAQLLDTKILRDAASVSSLLGDLVSLATSQVYGSTQLVTSCTITEVVNAKMFMKNIGGTSAR